MKLFGEVAEWSKATASKAVIPGNRDRGFESHPLHQGNNMSLPTRNSIKVLLLNENKLLLLYADDPKTTSVEGEYHGPFWFPVGGEIELGETPQEAALREIYEETGIKKENVELGPIVWEGEFTLVLAGTPVHIKEQFIIARTKQNKVSLSNLTKYEKAVIKKAAWFSLEDIENCKEIIYPVLLKEYLANIIAGKYPDNPLNIDLAKKPDKN